MQHFPFNGWIPITPHDFSIEGNFYKPDKTIIIDRKEVKMYLSRSTVAADEDGDRYLDYHITLKSEDGFTVGRLMHAGYGLLINSIDDVFDGDNIWEQASLSGIKFDTNTDTCYVKTSS